MKKLFMIIASLFFMLNIMPTKASKAASFLSIDEFSVAGLYFFDKKEYSLVNAKNFVEATNQFLSTYESDVSVTSGGALQAFNIAPKSSAQEVSQNLAYTFKTAVEFNRLTNGAFNPALYNASQIWGFSPEFEGQYTLPRPEPSAEKLAKAKSLSNVKFLIEQEFIANGGYQIRLFSVDNKYYLEKNHSELTLDFGGIAKGVALDLLMQNLTQTINKGYVSLQSSSVFLGNFVSNNNGEFSEKPFSIGVENPRIEVLDNAYSFKINNISSGFVSTSSDSYRSYFYKNKRYSHIINPQTASPTDSDVISATIIGQSGAATEAYSTAAMVLGLKQTLKLFKDENINSLIITSDNKYYVTGNLQVENISQGQYFAANSSEHNKSIIIAVIFSALSISVVLFLIIRSKNEKQY